MNAFVVLDLYVNFDFDNSKVSVFVDAHGVRVYEDQIGVSLCFMEISCYGNKLLLLLSTSALNITAPNTVNTDNTELLVCN